MRSLFFFTLLTLCSCASLELQYTDEAKDWTDTRLPDTLDLVHTVYLLGDAGGSKEGYVDAGIKYFGQQLDSADANSTAIFLGDNIYSHGLPTRSDPERLEAEHKINVQVDILQNFKGHPHFIPGNHDWYSQGVIGARRQENYVENRYDAFENPDLPRDFDVEDLWLPNDGCSGPEVREVNDDLVIIFIDSEWYIVDWNASPSINSGCKVRTRRGFRLAFENAVKKYRDRNIIVALHHPPFTNGPHGGVYTWKSHLFPITAATKSPLGYIPMPVIGSIAVFFRAATGTRSDVSFPRYRELRDLVIDVANKNGGDVMFVSGHEHNLQYFERDENIFIVSGAGSKENVARVGRGAEFVYGSFGHANLYQYEDGSMWIEFYKVNEREDVDLKAPKTLTGEVVFRKQMKGPLKKNLEETIDELPEEYMVDSITVRISDEPTKSKTHKALWGEHYRDAYAQEIRVPVLDMEDYRGGVVPIRRGGGYQTNSLRLSDENGREYVMRSLEKDPTRAVPYPFNQSFAVNIFRDQFSATHPLAAVLVPRLADAANVYHTNPVVYYVPKQPALGSYNGDFGNGLYLVEERPDGDWSDADFFGYSDDIVSTPKLTGRLEKNHKHEVDQRWVARSRVFDMLIGDWDRHDDQWRWASFKDEERDVKIYRPIPRDRDQAFSRYDGFVTGLLRLTFPFVKQLRPYDAALRNPKNANYNPRHFDRAFLNEVPWSTWQEEIEFIQNNVTDAVIEEAFAAWPEAIYQLDGEDLQEKMRQRRALLPEIVRNYYEFLAKKVTVAGTDKRERFLVERLNNDSTLVSIYALSNKKGKQQELLYQRAFLSRETKEINLFGLGDEDEFITSGTVDKGPLIRLVGGLDADVFTDDTKVRGIRNKTKVFDTEAGNILNFCDETEDCTSRRPQVNTFDRLSNYNEHNYFIPLLRAGYNPDDGFLLGGLANFYRYGFQKEGFSQIHSVSGVYAFATNGYRLSYDGEFLETAESWDFLLSTALQGPLFTVNYFGEGNETDFDRELDFDFNRIRQQKFTFAPGIRARFQIYNEFIFRLNVENVEIERTPGRIVSELQISDRVFADQWFLGPEMEANFQNLDNRVNVGLGLKFNFRLGWKANVVQPDRNFGYLNAALSFYQPITPGRTLVYGGRFGYGLNTSEQYDFFQGQTLGSRDNFRGVRQERYNGKQVFYWNNDLRLRLFRSRNRFLPFTFGAYGGYDLGRVFLPTEDSNLWHQSYGGGIWISPLDQTVITAGLFENNRDGTRGEVRLGFFF